jgi:uncharacterized membrane protein
VAEKHVAEATAISKRGILSPIDRRTWVAAAVGALIVGYVVLYSWLAILRHKTFGSGAMDLGYTDQVVWNTLHGRPFRFSTYQNAPIDLPLEQFRRTDNLLGYHVELLLLPISLLYLIYDHPITLLVLQVVGIALGAWPAFLLARQHLRSDLAGLTFASAYLLAPALQGAALSDFHAVSLCASLLLFAMYFAQSRRFGPFFVVVIAAMMCKEEISALVVMIGLYVFFVLRERRVGTIVSLLGAAWFVICTRFILPYFSGLSLSPFLQRLATFGPTLKESLLNALRDPLLVLRWLGRREIVTYLGGLLACGGFMSLFAPQVLGLALPVLALNIFSNWSWTYSEGAHYSASIVPFVIVSAIYGTGMLARTVQHWRRVPYRRAATVLAALVLTVSIVHHYQIGVSPIGRTFYPPRIDAHDRLGEEFVSRIPPQASVSAQSNLYPHLAHRVKAYFFPAVNDAEYVLLDVTSPAYPLTVRGLWLEAAQLLRSAQFGVLAAEDGYLLLKRNAPPSRSAELPAAFYRFAHAGEGDIAHGMQVRFGDALELVGVDVTILNLVQAHELPVQIKTFWRALRPLAVDYEFCWFFTRSDGAIVYHYDQGTPTTIWLPPSEWQEGQVMALETPILSVGRLRDALVAVTPPGGDPWSPQDRLPIKVLDTSNAELRGDETLLKLLQFP